MTPAEIIRDGALIDAAVIRAVRSALRTGSARRKPTKRSRRR